MTKPRLTKEQREAQRERDYRDFHAQARLLRIPPWESHFVPVETRGKKNPFVDGTGDHSRWEKMAAIQRRLDERRARRAAVEQSILEEQ